MQASVHLYETHQQASLAAANAVAAGLRRLIAERGRAIGVFSGDASQAELLNHLANADGIEWTRVIGFHTFELLGADEGAPHSQRKVLFDHLVYRVPMVEFHGLRGEAANPEAVCANYAALLKTRPPDFAILSLSEDVCTPLAPLADSEETSLVRSLKAGKMGSVLSLTAAVFRKCSQLFVLASRTPDIADLPASLKTHAGLHIFAAKELQR